MIPVLHSRIHDEVLIECGDGVYYIWNRLTKDLWRIDEPKDVGEILNALNDYRLKVSLIEEISLDGVNYVKESTAQHLARLDKEYEEYRARAKPAP